MKILKDNNSRSEIHDGIEFTYGTTSLVHWIWKCPTKNIKFLMIATREDAGANLR